MLNPPLVHKVKGKGSWTDPKTMPWNLSEKLLVENDYLNRYIYNFKLAYHDVLYLYKDEEAARLLNKVGRILIRYLTDKKRYMELELLCGI